MQIDRTSRRILGSLIEKRWTTPEQYPLTLNALVLACNQKSNRDPVIELQEFIVEGCLYQLRLAGLVSVVERDVGRVVRYAELMSDKLGLSRQDQAILAELMLRGPQTSPELLRRSSRMADFQSAEEIEGILQGMATKHWTKLLPRESGQRHARWTHLFAPEGETTEQPSAPVLASVTTPIVHPIADSVRAVEIAPTGKDVAADLAAELAELRREIAELRARLDRAGA